MRDHKTQFAGFHSPNTTPVPDQLFDELLAALSGAEVKVLLYICRRTFGFKKQRDPISLNQMLAGIRRKNGRQLDRGVGLSKATLVKALKSLKKMGCIVTQPRQSLAKGNETTIYELRIVNSSPPSLQTKPGGVQKLNQGLVQKLNPQETEKQQTDKTVNVNEKQELTNKKTAHPVKYLPKLTHPAEKTDLLADDILAQLGDSQSRNFYRLVAARVPESVIRQVLAEISADGAEYPARLFTHRMAHYARRSLQTARMTQLETDPDRQPSSHSWTTIGSAIARREKS